MKKFLLAFILNVAFFSTSFALSENYTLDPSHSYVEFHINHFGYSNPSGKWLASGTLNLDENKLQNSSVNISIPIKDVITGIPKLDEHLQSADFFDSAKYPTATFVSTKVLAGKNHTFIINGILTLHGISKPVSLKATQNKIAVNPMFKVKVAGFSAVTKIKRSDFGIKAYIPDLADEVILNIEVEAHLDAVKSNK